MRLACVCLLHISAGAHAFDWLRIADKYGVDMRHAWGMTEMSPIGTVNPGVPTTVDATKEQARHIKLSQGPPIYTVEMRIVDDDGKLLPQDGVT